MNIVNLLVVSSREVTYNMKQFIGEAQKSTFGGRIVEMGRVGEKLAS